jgi:hypothetical protein
LDGLKLQEAPPTEFNGKFGMLTKVRNSSFKIKNLILFIFREGKHSRAGNLDSL